MLFVWKLLNLKLGNGSQIVHVGYTKLICNILVFFKYAQMYSLIQIKCIYIYIYIYSLSGHFIHINDSVYRWWHWASVNRFYNCGWRELVFYYFVKVIVK